MPHCQTNASSCSTPDQAVFFTDAALEPRTEQRSSQILACLDDDQNCHSVAKHGLAMATTLGLPITFAHVMESAGEGSSPADPVEWHIRLGKCRAQLDQMIEKQGTQTPIESLLLSGSSGGELNDWAREHGGALLTLARHGRRGTSEAGLGITAQKILNQGVASLLLVPSDASEPASISYRKLLVPLDGSCRAESILPIVVRIARAHGAEVVLVHVVAQVDTIEVNSHAEAARELCSMLREHNEDRARRYLEQLRSRLRMEGVTARTLIESRGDPREQLQRIALQCQSDLMLVSSHGRSGLSDVACGSVTAYLADHAPCPLLIIRPSFRLGAIRSHGDDPEASPRELAAR